MHGRMYDALFPPYDRVGFILMLYVEARSQILTAAPRALMTAKEVTAVVFSFRRRTVSGRTSTALEEDGRI